MSSVLSISNKKDIVDRRYYFAILFGAGSFVVVLVLSIFLIRPMVDHFLSISKDYQYRSQEEVLLKQKVSDLGQLKTNYDQLGADNRSKILVAMPTDADQSHLTSIVATLAGQSGVLLSGINYNLASGSSPADAAAAAQGTSVQVSIQTSGPYSNILAYLVSLETGPRAMDVTSVQLSGKSPTVNASITTIAHYNPKAVQ